MSEIATSNRASLAIVQEAVFKVTPNNPVFTKIRYTGESLGYDISTTQSNELRDDRNVANTVQVKGGTTGDIQFEFSSESFDTYIEAVMCSNWTSTALVVDACDDAWNEITNPNVTSTADAVDFRTGTASAKFVVAVGAVANEVLASEAITSANLTTSTALRVWIKSSVNTTASDLKFLLDDTVSCASPIETISIPALTANVWTAVTLPLATPGACTAIISIGIRQTNDIGAFTLNIDSVTALPEVGTIKNGVVNRTFSIQKVFNDATVPVYNTFRGQKFGSFSLDFKSGSILTGKFGLSGSDAIMSTTQLAGATFIEAGSDVPMNGVNNVTSIKEDTVTSVQAYKSITLNLDNSPRAQDAIGSLGPIGIALGTCNVTGGFDVYFSDLAMYNRFLNNTAMNLTFKAQDSTGSFYEFVLPLIKIESCKVTSGGKDQDIMATCTYRAIYDPVTKCTLQINRSYV